jgi:hypothetical protein
MKQTINEYTFTEAFARTRPNQFSYEGLKALFEHLEEMEEGTGEEMELDVIAICCDYAEYENLEEFQRDYGTYYDSLDAIEDETELIYMYSPNNDKFIIRQF